MRLKAKSKTRRDIFKKPQTILNQIRRLSMNVKNNESCLVFPSPNPVFDYDNELSE